jgi:hypothetical protein
MSSNSSNDDIDLSEWSRAKPLKPKGYSAPQLARYADSGLIRSAHIKLPGQKRGIRLFNVLDLKRLLNNSIERDVIDGDQSSKCSDEPTRPL